MVVVFTPTVYVFIPRSATILCPAALHRRSLSFTILPLEGPTPQASTFQNFNVQLSRAK